MISCSLPHGENVQRCPSQGGDWFATSLSIHRRVTSLAQVSPDSRFESDQQALMMAAHDPHPITGTRPAPDHRDTSQTSRVGTARESGIQRPPAGRLTDRGALVGLPGSSFSVAEPHPRKDSRERRCCWTGFAARDGFPATPSRCWLTRVAHIDHVASLTAPK
jgi:hypothetical protein